MSTDIWLEPAVAIVALGTLSLASIVEASLATVNRLTLRELIEDRASAHRVQPLIERPQSIRSTMVLIELVSATVAVTMIGRVFARATPGLAVPLTLVVGSLALLVAGGVLPSALTSPDRSDEPRRLLRISSGLTMLAWPLQVVARGLTSVFSRLIGPSLGDDGERGILATEEPATDSDGEERGLQEEEQEMISGVLGLETATVRDLMVPRIDMVAVPEDIPVAGAVDLIRSGGHSRIPVYRDSVDTVVGVLYAKDLLRFVREAADSITVKDLVRPAYFVPESKHVDDLLRELRLAKVHIAIVVDEYGGTAGLVTIEDILEEIVGEIQDEYDRETPPIERVGPDAAIVDGLIPVDEVADLFDTDFADGESGTVGGFVQRRLGRIPAAGETLRADGLLLEVQSVEHHRIRKLRIERAVESAAGAPATRESA